MDSILDCAYFDVGIYLSLAIYWKDILNSVIYDAIASSPFPVSRTCELKADMKLDLRS